MIENVPRVEALARGLLLTIRPAARAGVSGAR